MNRKQRMMAAYREIASKAVDAHLEYSTTYVFAACVLALNDVDAEVDWEKFFNRFTELYPEMIKTPDKGIKMAEDILGADIQFYWTK